MGKERVWRCVAAGSWEIIPELFLFPRCQAKRSQHVSDRRRLYSTSGTWEVQAEEERIELMNMNDGDKGEKHSQRPQTGM